MKTLLVLSLALFSAAAHAGPTVNGARLNVADETVEVDLGYGGCGRQSFKLEMGACAASYPGHCSARVVSLSPPSPCEMYMQETVTFDLKEFTFTPGSRLTIYADDHSKGTTVTVPR